MTYDAETWELFPVLKTGGAPFLNAYVPRIERRFDSPLHQPANSATELEEWIDQMAALHAGRVPLVRLDLQAEGWSHDGGAPMGRKVVTDALEAGFAAAFIVADDDAYVYADVARTDRIADTVDLADLEHDVRMWLTAAGAWDGSRRDELAKALEELSTARYSQYLNVITRLSTFHLDTGLVHAIVTGDHPASQVAFYLRHLLDDEWFWHRVDESPDAPW